MLLDICPPPMFLDICPLCLYHNQPMILTQQTLHPRRFLDETYYWFACPVQDCHQRYDTKRGYCVMREGTIEDTTNSQPCAECGLFLYMAKRAATMADTVWLCANEKCPSNALPTALSPPSLSRRSDHSTKNKPPEGPAEKKVRAARAGGRDS